MTDDIFEQFRDDISDALATEMPISLTTTFGPDGTEPSVALLIGGAAVFHYRRDELLEALYCLGCDVLEELEQAGLPLEADRP